MATKINPLEIKREMIDVYESYLKNPEDKKNRRKIHDLWGKYDMSTGYSFYDSATEKAVGYLGFLLQGGRHEYFTKERVTKEANKILEELRKS
jgi:hypothetical protein